LHTRKFQNPIKGVFKQKKKKKKTRDTNKKQKKKPRETQKKKSSPTFAKRSARGRPLGSSGKKSSKINNIEIKGPLGRNIGKQALPSQGSLSPSRRKKNLSRKSVLTANAPSKSLQGGPPAGRVGTKQPLLCRFFKESGERGEGTEGARRGDREPKQASGSKRARWSLSSWSNARSREREKGRGGKVPKRTGTGSRDCKW